MAARSQAPGANVLALAREIGLLPSQLFGWWSMAAGKGKMKPVSNRTTGTGTVEGMAIELFVQVCWCASALKSMRSMRR